MDTRGVHGSARHTRAVLQVHEDKMAGCDAPLELVLGQRAVGLDLHGHAVLPSRTVVIVEKLVKY
jgi:hypothetical protein